MAEQSSAMHILLALIFSVRGERKNSEKSRSHYQYGNRHVRIYKERNQIVKGHVILYLPQESCYPMTRAHWYARQT
jgi:hypothetical protein